MSWLGPMVIPFGYAFMAIDTSLSEDGVHTPAD